MWQQQERRKARRFSTRLKVIESDTNILLGYCEDISISGLRLMSEVPPPANRELQVRLGETEIAEGIRLTLFRVWHSISETIPRYYYSGMHIVDPSEQAMDRIQDLIDDLFVKYETDIG